MSCTTDNNNTRTTLTFGSLFSGIGGIDLGFERAGLQCKWQVEIDKRCQRVLAKHWPNVPRFADVRECGVHNLETVDVICGGFPCQTVSVAGRQKGASDERWLWPEFSRIIGELRPRYVVLENVPGLLSQEKEFGEVLSDLAEYGFDAEWASIPAAAFGAPHLRYRVFLVAYTSVQRLEGGGKLGQALGEAVVRQRVFVSPRCPDFQSGWWTTEPGVDRVVTRLRDRAHRIKQLGNAVVPQVAEYVAKCLLRFDSLQTGN